MSSILKSRITRGLATLLCAGGLLQAVGLLAPLQAMFATGQEAPVDRLQANTRAYVRENPQDAEGYYVLGRIDALAFVLKTGQLTAFPAEARQDGKKNLERLDELTIRHRGLVPAGEAQALTPEAATALVKESVESFRSALRLHPEDARYRLGLAYILDQAARQAESLGTPPASQDAPQPTDEEAGQWDTWVRDLGDEDHGKREQAQAKLRAQAEKASPILRRHLQDADLEIVTRIRALLAAPWVEAAIQEYWKAYQSAIKHDLELKELPITGIDTLIAYEASQSYLRLIRTRPLAQAEQDQVAQAERDLEQLKKIPRCNAITPIVFDLERARPLGDLLLPASHSVRFDLDGDGRVEEWSWVGPETGILVWDPEGRGVITSGTQLFGSVTWWIFWRDGYHALDALDDNRDGLISGAELKGLGVWRDRNSNGISDPGEVTPIEETSIAALETRVRTPGDRLARPTGLRLKGGGSRPTFDWIAQRAPEPEPELSARSLGMGR